MTLRIKALVGLAVVGGVVNLCSILDTHLSNGFDSRYISSPSF